MRKITIGFVSHSLLWKIELTNGEGLVSEIRAGWIENPIGYKFHVEIKKGGRVYLLSKIFETYKNMKEFSEAILNGISLTTAGKVPTIFRI